MAYRLRDFTRMTPATFYGFKVEKDPQEFIEEVYNFLFSMWMTTRDK